MTKNNHHVGRLIRSVETAPDLKNEFSNVELSLPRELLPAPVRVTSRAPNLLVLGGCGHVARAFLRGLGRRRSDFGRLILVDQNDGVLRDSSLRLDDLDACFVRRRFEFPRDTPSYQAFLRRHQIDIVLDVTDLETLPVLAATDAAGVSYVNTALNDCRRGIPDVLEKLHPTRELGRQAAHILSSGMNPGVVNLWVWHAVENYGIPEEIVHFEYDTSMAIDGWRPLITWSRKEFLTEAVWEPTGLVYRGRLKLYPSNGLSNREDLRPIMEPILPLPSYPRGMLILHEENIKLGRRLGVSSKYIYAIHPQTMDYLERLWRERRTIEIDDLIFGDNIKIPLRGSDTIGVCLDYPDRRVYYVHTPANEDVVGTNATCAQVAVGIHAALTTLRSQRLAPRLYFPTDLYNTVYQEVVFKGLSVEQTVLEKLSHRSVSAERQASVKYQSSGLREYNSKLELA